jgi:GH25 family lysozyme M1 (1,4-beta-N-acetylmuramidase)
MGIKFTDFSIRGIDVSTHNGVIDWTKVKCDFAAIRVGYGRVVDSKLKENWKNAKGKVKRIPYWYLDYYSNHMAGAVNGVSDKAWGKEQAVNCWNAIKDDSEAIVFLDIERTNVDGAPLIEEVLDRVQRIAKAFLQEIDRLTGNENGIYTSPGCFDWYPDWFRDRPLWVAWYPYRTVEGLDESDVIYIVEKQGWKTKPLIWQYASDGDMDDNGTGDGRSMGMQYATLDLNGWLGTAVEFATFFGDTPDDDVIVVVQPKYIEYKVTAWPRVMVRKYPEKSSLVINKLSRNSKVKIYVITMGDGTQKLGWGRNEVGYISMDWLKKI